MNLFVYGSLMHKGEIEDMFGSDADYDKWILKGYIRDFSKIAHSWGEEGEEVGVLGIQEHDHCWCNGLLIRNVSEEQMNAYYLRETGMRVDEYDVEKSGYRIVEISNADLHPYNSDSSKPTDSVLTSLINNRLGEQNTHDEYRNLCFEAAKQHGSDFYNDFRRTTFEYF